MDKNLISKEVSGTSLWDYDNSVDKMKSLIISWKNISVEILEELYIARKVLNSQGVRNDLSGEKKGWEHYLDDIGLAKSTVNRWLKKYDPGLKRIISEEEKVVESVVLPKELEGTVNNKLETKHNCPHCGYEW